MSTMQKHLAAISSGKVEKTNIIGLRKAFNHVARTTNGWSGNRSNATHADVYDAVMAINECHPTVVGELHDTGLKVLRSPHYAKRWTAEQRAVIEAKHVRFDLVRFDRLGHHGEYAVPVYCVIALEGVFNFRNIPWQSGGNGPEVVD